MRLNQAFFAASSLASLSEALQLAEANPAAPKVLQAPIQRKHVADPIAHDRARLRKRQSSGTVQQSLDNEKTLYFADASLGTPAQKLRLHLDTGSSDLWANAPNSTFCQDDQNDCADAGTYDATASSTYKFVNDEFNISYVDGSGANGIYASDTFNFGGQSLEDMQFGIGFTSSSSEGILGIGYTINEVQVNRFGGDQYPNLPQLLVDRGLIQTNAYSLWLNDLDASTGSILFGGVDTQKYTGSLQTLPIIPSQGYYAEFIIALTELGVNGNNGSLLSSSDSPIPVLLDSGSSLMYLPDDIAASIYDQLDARYIASQGAAFIDCAKGDETGSLEFTFSSPTISVPLNELVIVAGESRGREVCILGISPSGGSTAVLGDTFLRSAYVVYDLANNTISLAPTNFNATESNILEITATGGVPDAEGVSNAVTNLNAGTGGARNGGIPNVDSNFDSGAPSDPKSGGFPKFAIPLIAVGSFVPLLGIV